MTCSFRLPVHPSEQSVQRRRVLLLGATAVGVAACGGVIPDGADVSSGTDVAAPDAAGGDSAPPTDGGGPADVAPACTPGPTMVGMVSDFVAGTWTLVQSPTVIIAQDNGGLHAYSSVCTHQGCIVDPPDSSGQADCQCHGSMFDGNGAVVRGPARRPLNHYAVNVCDNVVYVDQGMVVSSDTRTPV